MYRRKDGLPQHYNRQRDKVTLIILIVALAAMTFLSVGTYLALKGTGERDDRPAMAVGSGGYMTTYTPTSSPTSPVEENQSKTDDSDKTEANEGSTKTDEPNSEQVEGQTTTDIPKENEEGEIEEKKESQEGAVTIDETLAPTAPQSIDTSPDGTKATPFPTPSQSPESSPASIKETMSPTSFEEELPPTEEMKIEETASPTISPSLESSPAGNITLSPKEEDALIRENSILDVLAEVSPPLSPTQAANWLLHHDPLQVHLESDPIQSESEEGIVKVSKEKMIQRYVLAVLYYSLEMDNSELAASEGENVFLSGVDECEWQNVVCNDQGLVTGISISEAGLSGTLPDELSHLTYLEILDFNTNRIKGTIPTTLKDLKNLSYIDFSGNDMTGDALPKELLQEDSPLQYVYLGSNKFSGTIARDIRNLLKTRYLWLDNNEIEGRIPWEIGKLESLEVLILSSNNLEGTIPRSVRLLPNLTYVDLSGNYLGGKLTRAVYDIPSLKYLYLNDNEFRGTVPPVTSDAASQSNLLHLWLNENFFDGDIPTRLGRLTKLESLLLQDNDFEGEVPDEICELRENNLQNLEVDCFIECSEDCCTHCV